MLSANILISIQGHAVKNSAYSKDILCTPSWDLFPVMRVKIYYRFTCLYLQLDILSKFEVRIHKLEDTIVPVHRETDDLQRRQASILKKHKTTHQTDKTKNNISSHFMPCSEINVKVVF